MKQVGIINYNAGNTRSLINSFEKINYRPKLISEPNDLINIEHVVLPGVGAFRECILNLKKNKTLPIIIDKIKTKKIFFLGICLGMQMLFDESEEFEMTEGLHLIEGKVQKLRINKSTKIPHVGWNEVTFKKGFGNFKTEHIEDFYFDHSYGFLNNSSPYCLAECNDDFKFVAAVIKDNVIGVQFHPEKSQISGLNFLKYFMSQKC